MARKKTTPDQAMLDAVREKAAASETKELELKNGVVLPKKELELKTLCKEILCVLKKLYRFFPVSVFKLYLRKPECHFRIRLIKIGG